MRVRRTLALALAFCLAAPAPAVAQNSGPARLTDRDDLLGWEAVGKVDLGGGGYCTGVLIATDLVLTAAHCVYDAQAALRQPGTVSFRAGLRDGQTIATRAVRRIVAHSGYDPRLPPMAGNIRHDAALLELDSAIPAATAAPFLVHEGVGAGTRVSVVSYGAGRDDALSWQRDCGVLGRQVGLLVFDCDVTHGSSGAPVFTRANGRARILSLISSGSRQGDGAVSFGMELPQIVDRLKRDLRAMPLPPSRGGNIRRITVGSARSGSGAKFVKP